MANKTVTVKSASGDYSSLNAALAGESANLVTGTCILTIECYGMNDTTAASTGTGYTTNSSYYINIVAANRHPGTLDTSGASYYMTNGSDWAWMLSVYEFNTRVTGIQIVAASQNRHGILLAVDSASILIDKCIIKLANGDGSTGILIRADQVRNCIVYNCVIGIQVNDWYAGNLYNNTAVDCGTGFGSGGPGNATIKNCVAYGCTTAYQNAASWAAGCTNNASDSSDAATIPGANDQTSVESTDFVNYAGDDFHRASGSTKLAGTGADLSGIFTDDIDGDTRSVPFDIGADQGAAVSGPANLKTVHGLVKANVKTIQGLSLASVKTLQGLN